MVFIYVNHYIDTYCIFIIKNLYLVSLIAVHPFGPVNLNELLEEIPQKIGLMRKIISQFKNNLSTEISQIQPGSEQTLKNYIIQLKVKLSLFLKFIDLLIKLINNLLIYL